VDRHAYLTATHSSQSSLSPQTSHLGTATLRVRELYQWNFNRF
jgi:hypothetical protein